MEILGTAESEDRISALEKKLPEMEALVKGLLEELLDIKAFIRKMSRDSEESSRQQYRRGAIVQGATSPEPATPDSPVSAAVLSEGSTVIRVKGIPQPDIPVAPAEPKMVRIMQSDGTMKLEPRYGDKRQIDSSGGNGRNLKGVSANSKQNRLIEPEEQDPSDPAKK